MCVLCINLYLYSLFLRGFRYESLRYKSVWGKFSSLLNAKSLWASFHKVGAFSYFI